MFINKMPRYEILFPNPIAVLDRGRGRGPGSEPSSPGHDLRAAAFGAHEEVGHGGRFLGGAAHIMERFRECFHRPVLSSTANYERYVRLSGADATARAWRIVCLTPENFEPRRELATAGP